MDTTTNEPSVGDSSRPAGQRDSTARVAARRVAAEITDIRNLVGIVVGLVAAAFALGVAEMLAGIVSTWKSPIIDVGDRFIELVPPFVKDIAIELFGTNDKVALVVGIGVLLAIYGAVIGALSFRRDVRIGLVGFALFGLIGFVAVVTKATDPGILATTPIVGGTLLGATVFYLAHRFITADAGAHGDHDTSEADEISAGDPSNGDSDADSASNADTEVAGSTRRQVLVRSGGVVAVLALAGGGTAAFGRRLRSRFSAADSRRDLRLPVAAEPLAEAPDAVTVDVDNMSDFYTPNETFYRIDTALTVPQLRTEDYNLTVSGMVDNTINLSFDDLVQRNVQEYDITLTCVSNTVGGNLIGNARWLGVRLDELLEEAGVSPDATQVVGRSIDGYTCGFPIEAATDGRNALVAFGMNGEPLPLEHGFPVRLIVPGLYGYISATKWLTEIELTTFEDFESYWVPRGYADRAPIKIQSRIDTVDGLGTLERDADGVAAIGGVAWAQTRGISAVEVKIDDGEWEPAELGEALNDDTWRQWAYRWTPASEGRSSITTRAIDGNGEVQTDERVEPLPNGASGHHQIVVFIA
ncbi:MAG: molybdopterin-dependent oxidoreductase [Ilumatobacter sp.]|uniref:molybdopterin-dependent oxidoreductase n=1 Tax=Ilumatobacter sp. TaxID=1967498 RepID=UPI0032982849